MGGIDDDQVHAGLGQGRDAVRGLGAGAHGGAGQQAAVGILGGMGEGARLLDVLEGDQATQAEGVVHHQHLLDPVLLHLALDHVEAGALRHGDQALAWGHDVGDTVAVVGLEAHVTLGDDAHQGLALDHREAGEAVLLGHGQQVLELGLGTHGDRVLDDHALVLLDLAHLGGLVGDGHVLVDDADAPFLGHGDRQARLGHGIHGRGEQRDVEVKVAGQAGPQADVLGQDLGVAGYEKDVVERQGFLGHT